jgi:HD-GYP domain-containing protein (c-di-GMP phosphodiesterase class II)
VRGTADRPRARLAELVAALSLGVDLGFGQPMEHVLRQCLIALRLARHAGLGEQDRMAVYYTALLVNVGCHADAHEQAKWFGDDITLKSGKYAHELGSARGVLATMRLVGAGNPPLHRFRVGLEFAVSGRHQLDGMISQHARLARTLAEQLELPGAVREGVGAAYEQWDGRGWPGTLKAGAIPVAARIAQFAEFMEVAHRVGGVAGATALARRRAGRQFDPALTGLLCSHAEEIFARLEAAPAWRTVIAAEPALAVELSPDQFDRALAAIASFVDLKSPFTLGHSVAVAELAEEAGRRLGLPAEQVRALRRAGFVHGFGRLGVSNSIWDRPGPLSAGEWERVRMYPYLTERMLHQSAVLAPLGEIAVQVRERLDGSGYPRGLSGGAISRPARLLGAADAYASMREPRPHRPARSADEAATELRAEVRAGRLDGTAVDAVLEAAGHRLPRRREGLAGLTAREVEVLVLLARGLSNKQIAERLVITPKTAGNHVEHIYAKIGASSRAAAAMFAVQHGLLPEEKMRQSPHAPAAGPRLPSCLLHHRRHRAQAQQGQRAERPGRRPGHRPQWRPGRHHGQLRDHPAGPLAGPAAARAARRQLPVPALGIPARREDHRQLRRPEGDLPGGRRLLHDARARPGRRDGHGVHPVQPQGAARRDHGRDDGQRAGDAALTIARRCRGSGGRRDGGQHRGRLRLGGSGRRGAAGGLQGSGG